MTVISFILFLLLLSSFQVSVRLSFSDSRNLPWASLMAQRVKSSPFKTGDSRRDVGSIPGSGRSPGRGNGNPPQYSCMKNPMDRGALRAVVQRVAKSQTQLNSRTANVAHSNSSWGSLHIVFFPTHNMP